MPEIEGPWQVMVDTWHDGEVYVTGANPQDKVAEVLTWSTEDAWKMAAAPEMLVAFESMVNIYCGYPGCSEPTHRDWWNLITKAKGEA